MCQYFPCNRQQAGHDYHLADANYLFRIRHFVYLGRLRFFVVVFNPENVKIRKVPNFIPRQWQIFRFQSNCFSFFFNSKRKSLQKATWTLRKLNIIFCLNVFGLASWSELANVALGFGSENSYFRFAIMTRTVKEIKKDKYY